MLSPKLLIDDAKFHIAGIATSWDYDNRSPGSPRDVFPDTLRERSRYKRDFLPQTDGRFSLEMLYRTQGTANGVSVEIQSTGGTPLFTVGTKEDRFFFDGKDTSFAAPVGDTRIRVDFDLVTRKVAFAYEGKTLAEGRLADAPDASRLVIAHDGTEGLALSPLKNRLARDYLVNETFLYSASDFADNWRIDGEMSLAWHGDSSPQMNYSYAVIHGKAGKTAAAYYPCAKTAENLILEGYFLLPKGEDGLAFSLMNGEKATFTVRTKDKTFVAPDGAPLRRFTENVWQLVRLETSERSLTVKIDGKTCGSFPLEDPASDGVRIAFSPKENADVAFADVILYTDPPVDDYCPAPDVVRHPDYEVGMNVCNMWREGHHFGWDRITYFKANTPLIGPYDEGNPELADWEIKFMTEHGVTFQHVCWYCPDSMIASPIKRSRMDAALRDGFMNARYSDRMKFIIMWENNGYANTDPEAFKKYVWPYWCDYFFTDPRYLKIDNKPLMSLWALKFIDNWGGPEKADEIIAFMNEDIKNYGCDGILLMATASAGSRERYETMSRYTDITYAYHYGAGGYDPETQLAAIGTMNRWHDEGLSPFMQTVSVGFNACPWHGAPARVPLITPDDFESVLRSVKQRADEKADKQWYDKLFMMSTWNEYGEGTYIMPAGLYGFGYLDRIRAVFVPEAGENENLLPDEHRRARLCTLRVGERHVIRRLGYEKSDFPKPADTVVFSHDLAGEDAGVWQPYNQAVRLDKTASGLLLTPVASHDHYSLECRAPFDARSASYVRVTLRAPAEKAVVRLAFLTDTDGRYAGNKCERSFAVEASDAFTAVEFMPGRFETWRGVITALRIDNMARTPFEIAGIEFMTHTDPEGKEPTCFVDGAPFPSEFDPVETPNGTLLSLDPGKGAMRVFGLYQEWNDAARTLTLASDRRTVSFTEGKTTARDGKTNIPLRCAFTLRDGLPTLAAEDLCALFGFAMEKKGPRIDIRTR